MRFQHHNGDRESIECSRYATRPFAESPVGASSLWWLTAPQTLITCINITRACLWTFCSSLLRAFRQRQQLARLAHAPEHHASSNAAASEPLLQPRLPPPPPLPLLPPPLLPPHPPACPALSWQCGGGHGGGAGAARAWRPALRAAGRRPPRRAASHRERPGHRVGSATALPPVAAHARLHVSDR